MNIQNRLERSMGICKYNLRSKCRRLAAENNIGRSERSACMCFLDECPKNSIGLKDNKRARSSKRNIVPSTSSASPVESASDNQMCSICFETILTKSNKTEQIFGILPNCNHCFCYSCITSWRQRQRDIMACPMCRIPSDVVYRSKCWLDNKQEKEELVKNSYEDDDVNTFSRSNTTTASSWSSSHSSASSSSSSLPSSVLDNLPLYWHPHDFDIYSVDREMIRRRHDVPIDDLDNIGDEFDFHEDYSYNGTDYDVSFSS